jgi:hypothetical protein
MDSLATTYQHYVKWVDELSSSAFSLPIRIALALTVSTIICAVVFAKCRHRLSTNVLMMFEWAFFLWASMMVTQAPLEFATTTPVNKAWYFSFALFFLAIAPFGLSFFLLNKAGPRKVLAWAIYACVALLFVLNVRRK